ncbi:flagellar biosynthesis protein FlhB [Rhizobium sp. L1K21]|uniref:flagellar biosynthesis protein FlhB n=1 Tax=Rhizobium sp. L1K21 TaxID=2954933 RepID=UPI002092B768|nr:flagellar biosynthesis protein FlhB [Rhizobium sp. L1K21]MCO6187136.1 flagellar biosynthesis protein FlhB [Rhizobium sp. L1K21]
MADEEKDSKTEDPTGKRLNEAADKGNVPFSKEITTFASTVAIYVFVVFFAASGAGTLAVSLRDVFELADQWDINTGSDVVSILYRLAWNSSAVLVPSLTLLIAFGVGASILQNLPRPVLERIRPQASRLSLMKGFQRLFSMQTVVEFGKSFVKILVVSAAMYLTLKDEFLGSLELMFSDPRRIFDTMLNDLRSILIIVILATAVIAIADYFWTKHKWFEDLKMSKQEVKDENKQMMGDPAVKAKQKSFARTLLRRQMMKNVPRATLVVTNPTHYAVALRYARDEDDAPIVVAKGQNLIALKIREIAEDNNIPIFEDPPLARSMFAQVSVDSVIPPVFYKAVAELIHRVYANQKKTIRA